jgi:hypothetical protein
MRQPNAGTSAPTKTVKVKAHTRAAPAEPSHVVRPPKPAPVKARVRNTPPRPSPDAQDATRLVKHPNVSHVSPDARDVAGRTPAQHQHDAAYAQDVQDAARGKNPTLAKELGLHPKPVKAKVKTGHGPGHVLGAINPNALVHAIGNVDAGGSMPVFSGLAHVIGRGVKDAEEMAVTLPSSVAHLASTAVHHPEKVPGELLAPYKQLAQHPVKSLSEHPLQTALMVAPAVRMPGRALGKGLRVTGKQTLERPAAELPGTALKVARTGSRDAVVRAFQSRADRKNGTPTATVKNVQTRVDEFHDMAQHHTQRVVASATKQAVKQAKAQGLDRNARRAAVQAKVDGARGGAHNQTDQKFVREFGAVHEVTPAGAHRQAEGRHRRASCTTRKPPRSRSQPA